MTRPRSPLGATLPGLLFLLLLLPGCAGTGSYPFDLPWVERDVCPFECCTYGAWTARAPLYLTDEPDVDAPVRRTIESGETFTALGGDVHVLEPGTAVVLEGRDMYADGEHLWVFSYRGEGNWDVWVSGDLVTMPLLVDRDAKGDPEEPAILLETPPRTRWWVEIVDGEGTPGWVLMDPNDLRVAGADSCG